MENIQTICVCGAGTMGCGIAQVAAMAGYRTIQFDLNQEMLDKSLTTISKNLQILVEKGKIDANQMDGIKQLIIYTNDIQQCIADVFIEAIVEKKEAKMELFHQLSLLNTKGSIFASNTSSLSINELANSFDQPERFIGLHFFNPAPLMKLVEVVRTELTDPDVIETICHLAKKMGKVPVVCKDAPGFIVNRVARHYYLEAMQLLQTEKISVEEIDAVMEASGFKMGPFKLMDLIGMDINYSVSNIVWDALGKPERLKPSQIQQQKVKDGDLGRKTGKGFYNYSK